MFTSAQLASYLERIGLSSPVPRNVDGLRRVHRAHVDSIPYENFDVQLRQTIRLDPDSLFDKLVTRRRGGFCYEQNGVLAHALEAMGFTVRRVMGGVDRARIGDGNWFNHLPLLVTLPAGQFLTDVGMGNGFRDPLPLREGSHRVGPFNFGLWKLDDDVWRCTIDPRIQDLTFDFQTETKQIEDFAAKCRELETSPESGFVKTLTVQQARADHAVVLRSRTFTVADPAHPDGKTTRVIEDLAAFSGLLDDEFGLTLPAADTRVLWERACEQHERWLAEQEDQNGRVDDSAASRRR